MVDYKRALIIQTAFIGDVVLTTPMIRILKKEFPQTMISLIVREDIKCLVENLPEISHIYGIKKGISCKSLIDSYRLIKKIRSESFDLLLSPHKSFRSALISLFSKIPNRFGYADASLAKVAYHQRIVYQKNKKAAARLASFLTSSLHLPPVNEPKKLIPSLTVSSSLGANMPRPYLQNLIRSLEMQKTIAIAPSSIWGTKRWTTWHFAFLCDLIIREMKQEIILLGSKSDQKIISRLLQFIKTFTPDRNHSIRNCSGKIYLNELYAVLQKCTLLISNDSAPAHIASAAQIPIVSIFGSTHPSQGFAPIGTQTRVCEIKLACRPCGSHGYRKCPKQHFRCMKELTHQQVYQSVRDLLSKNH